MLTEKHQSPLTGLSCICPDPLCPGSAYWFLVFFSVLESKCNKKNSVTVIGFTLSFGFGRCSVNFLKNVIQTSQTELSYF